MTRPNDPSDDMPRFPSPADAEGLLSGRIAADDLPEEAAPLARLLAGLHPVAADDPFTERRVVSDMTAEILRNPPDAMPSVLRPVGHRIPAKTGAALAFVAVLATGTAAAAANGSLPPSIQRAVSDALSHVSISVPHPAQHHPVQSHGGPDGRRNNGTSPGNATEPVTPRGAHGGKDGDKSPRGVTNETPGGTTTTVPTSDNGRHVGPPTSVPVGGRHVGPPTTNPNKANGKDNNNGQHNGDGNGNGTPTVTTPKTVKKNNGSPQGSQGGNAGANGNADSHASQQVSGGANSKGHAKNGS